MFWQASSEGECSDGGAHGHSEGSQGAGSVVDGGAVGVGDSRGGGSVGGKGHSRDGSVRVGDLVRRGSVGVGGGDDIAFGVSGAARGLVAGSVVVDSLFRAVGVGGGRFARACCLAALSAAFSAAFLSTSRVAPPVMSLHHLCKRLGPLGGSGCCGEDP